MTLIVMTKSAASVIISFQVIYSWWYSTFLPYAFQQPMDYLKVQHLKLYAPYPMAQKCVYAHNHKKLVISKTFLA